jgi:hypothetical protein
MSKYISDVSDLFCGVLQRAACAQPAQFAGYWANIDFWIAEYEHLIGIAAGYDKRWNAMKSAFDQYVALHGGPRNLDEGGTPYQAITKTNSSKRREAVWAAKEALERLVERAHQLGMIEYPQRDEFIERIKFARQNAAL